MIFMQDVVILSIPVQKVMEIKQISHRVVYAWYEFWKAIIWIVSEKYPINTFDLYFRNLNLLKTARQWFHEARHRFLHSVSEEKMAAKNILKTVSPWLSVVAQVIYVMVYRHSDNHQWLLSLSPSLYSSCSSFDNNQMNASSSSIKNDWFPLIFRVFFSIDNFCSIILCYFYAWFSRVISGDNKINVKFVLTNTQMLSLHAKNSPKIRMNIRVDFHH